MHIVIALRRRVRLFRLGVCEGFKKRAPGAGRGSGGFGISVTESTKNTRIPEVFDIGIIECAEGSNFSGRYTPKNLNPPAKASPRPRPPQGGGRQVRFFSARSGLATQGSNFYARESRPRQRVRNLTRKNSNPFSLPPQSRPTRRNARTCCFSFREGREKNPINIYPTRP